MDEALISKWNSVVTSRDEVWHLGDFCWDKKRIPEILKRLNGSIHLVRGNHDPESIPKLMSYGFASVHEAYYLRVGDIRIFLLHYSCRTWRNSVHGSWHLFGHSHGAKADLGKSTDVGVDCWNYQPVSIDALTERFKDREHVNHHEMDG